MPTTYSFCTFMVDDLYMAVNVHDVQEVLRGQEMTEVPLAPISVRGLINLRGQIVPAIDLRAQLQLPARSEGAAPMNVIVRTDEAPVSLLVDQICDVLNLEDTLLEEPPSTLDARTLEMISGVYKLKDRLLLILKTDRVLQPCADAA